MHCFMRGKMPLKHGAKICKRKQNAVLKEGRISRDECIGHPGNKPQCTAAAALPPENQCRQ
ncbi:hypothetical protein ARTHRO9AX_10201 [Arthrobacter sp. 9AX]|nr:hypothetical protein ARTHRO9AX_10201 [Arthrobacter sp. 9AX]